MPNEDINFALARIWDSLPQAALPFLRAGSSVILNGSIAGRIEFLEPGKHCGQEKCMIKLEGKIALITGGDNGIGLSTAEQVVCEGAYLVLKRRRGAEVGAAVKGSVRKITS